MSEPSSTRPYSDRVEEPAARAMATLASGMIARRDPEPVDVCRWHRDLAAAVLDAAHDRRGLGLDASVCARAVHEWIEDNCGDEMADQFEHRFSGLPSER